MVKLLLPGIFAAALTLIVGGIILVHRHTIERLAVRADEALHEGRYSAALVALEDLQARQSRGEYDADAELVSRIGAVKRLIVAEANFSAALEAEARGAWFDVRALLDRSAAVEDPSFVRYDEARALAARAAGEIAALEQSAAEEIDTLRRQAAVERREREQTERARQTAAAKLADETSAREKQAATLEETKRELAERSARLVEETARGTALAAVAAEEREAAFRAALEAPLGELERAERELSKAFGELAAGRAVTALVLLSQARVLVEEAGQKARALRESEEGARQAQADALARAANFFLTSIQALRNAVVYLEDGGTEFEKYRNDGSVALEEGRGLVISVRAEVGGR